MTLLQGLEHVNIIKCHHYWEEEGVDEVPHLLASPVRSRVCLPPDASAQRDAAGSWISGACVELSCRRRHQTCEGVHSKDMCGHKFQKTCVDTCLFLDVLCSMLLGGKFLPGWVQVVGGVSLEDLGCVKLRFDC